MTTPTNNPLTFGGVGKLEFAPTNAPDDPFPTWVDITQYVETQSANGGAPVDITRGRQSELNIVESSQLKCTLKNFDSRFTYGYTAGPYGPFGWGPGKQIRYSVTDGPWTKVLFQGWIEYPDIPAWQPIGPMYVQLTALDRLTRLGRSRPFVSTLGAQIQSAAGSSLLYYFPLNDLAGSAYATSFGGSSKLPVVAKYSAGSAVSVYAGVTFGVNDRPLGDDLSSCLSLAWNSTPLLASGQLTATLPTPIVFNAGQQMVIAAWVNPVEFPSATTFSEIDVIEVFDSHTGQGVSLKILGGATATTAPGTWTGGASGTFPAAATINGSNAATHRWTFAAGMFTLDANPQTLWVDGQTYTAVWTSGSPPASMNLDSITIGNQMSGSIAHVQIYLSAPSAVTTAMFTAQRQVGLIGYEQQTTGQRINTILDLAGVPSGPRQIDPGVTYMQKAKLAGQTPLQALQNASGTERGRLFVSGDGKMVFHDRPRIYNA